MIETAQNPEFFERAKTLIRVTDPDEIGVPYKNLQSQVNGRLEQGKANNQIPTAEEVFPAPMAVSSIAQTSVIHFTKFSTPGPLLGLYKQQQKLAEQNKGAPLLFATKTAVEYLITEVGFPASSVGEEATVKIVRTSRFTDLPVMPDRTKIILCAGAFPNTTLLLNSFQHVQSVTSVAGKTVTGHFLSHVVGRVKRSTFHNLNKESLELGAEYLAGRHPQTELQYHIQVTAITSPDPNQDAEDAARFCPDYAAAASEEQLRGSEDYVIFVCATLGELSENNPKSFFRMNPYPTKDPTANCVLQVVLDHKDLELWDLMDKATFDAIEVMAGKGQEIEWWHQPKPADKPGVWERSRPGVETIRMEGIVHEASTLPMGDDRNCCVDSNYKVKGVSNVYVTGGALFPTSGSWNPTLTMCGYAQDLAIRLTPKRND